VASLPDNWLMGVIKAVDRDKRFVHVPVNREESACKSHRHPCCAGSSS
jgi:sulfopyruvate decarboxylase TPP-binding subunit